MMRDASFDGGRPMILERLRRAVVPILVPLVGLLPPSPTAGRDRGAQQTRAAQDTAQVTAQEGSPSGSCITCHAVLGVENLTGPAESFHTDIHSERGFGCADCHGGDPSVEGPAAMDPRNGFTGVPAPRQIPGLCGRCHSDPEFMKRFNPSLRVDQVEEYWTSVHGQRLSQDGDTLVATCANCHRVHAIRPPSDATSKVYPLNVPGTCGGCHADSLYMAPYGIPTDQLARYQQSVHWEMISEEGDLSAPTCNDCHGNHGAAPPGVSSVGNVCGQCHSVMGDLFRASFHSEIFAMIGSPGCATCHGNHEIHRVNDQMLGVEGGAVCGQCHTAQDQGGQVAQTMRSLVDTLSGEISQADSILTRAEDAGMEVSQAQVDLHDARSALIRSRTYVHAFSVDSLRPRVDDGLEIAGATLQEGRDALKELQFRRLGLAVSSVLILVLIVALVLKIRQLGPGAGEEPK